MQTADAAARRHIAAAMFYGPKLFRRGKDILVLLTVVQQHHHLQSTDLLQRALIKNMVADIGLVIILIEIDHITHAEVEGW